MSYSYSYATDKLYLHRLLLLFRKYGETMPPLPPLSSITTPDYPDNP